MIIRTRLSHVYYSKLLILLIGFFSFQLSLFGQNTPQSINYQAVARDVEGSPLSETVLDVEISIVQGSPNGNEVYAELHEVITDVFGLFNLKIGNGVVLNSDFSNIDWGADISFLKVSIDVGQGTVQLPTVQLLSVPYALHSARADSASYGSDEDANPANELQTITKSDEMIVTLSNGGGTFTDEVADADADPVNELQELQLDGQVLTLSNDPSGTSVDLGTASSDNQQLVVADQNTDEVTLSLDSSPPATFSIKDADADSTNEFQTIQKVGSTVTLSNDGGEFTDEVNDADANATNELQTIDKNGSTVTLSDGGGSFTDEVDDSDADPANELQTINKAGNTVTLSDGGGSFIDAVNDADANPTNEQITTLNLTGANVLEIQEGSNDQSIDLSSLKTDESWTPNGSDIRNANIGNVGINEANPTSTLFVNGTFGAKVRIESPHPTGGVYLLGDEAIFIGNTSTGNVLVQLPDAITIPGRIYFIKKGTNILNRDVFITTSNGQTIDGEAFVQLGIEDINPANSTVWQSVILVSDGTNWFILSAF